MLLAKLQSHRHFYEYLLVIIGASLIGLAYNMFLLPARLAAGGLSGVSTILFELYQWSPSLVQFLMNIPIFIIGWLALGNNFSGKTLVGTFWVPFVIWLSEDIPYTVDNPLLAAVYGGVILGTGLGIVYRGRGSTGGTAAISQVVKKFTGISSGYSQLIVDSLVVIASLIVFDLETTLFAMMTIYISSKTIDIVQLRTASNKLILAITEQPQELQTLISDHIDRGLTKVNALGGYSSNNKTMILCVAEQQEAVRLRQLIQEQYPTTFVVFMNASEILGRGFSLDKYYGQKL